MESEAGSKTNFEPATNKCQINALLEKEQHQHTQFAKTSSKRLTTSIGRIMGLISSFNIGQISIANAVDASRNKLAELHL